MALSVDLNADLAEFDNRTNEALLGVVTSANVCCGVHSGDPLLTAKTLRLADQRGVRAGAHPSYPNRDEFGRKSMWGTLSDADLHSVIRFQLAGFASLTGGRVSYVKPHGALYNDAQRIPEVARIVAYQADVHGAAVMGQPGSVMEKVCQEFDVPFMAEVFADRGYDHSGALISRGLPNSHFTNPRHIAQRVVRMVTTKTVDTWGFSHEANDWAEGTYQFSAVDSVCLHGDTRGAYDIALAVRQALVEAGVEVRSDLVVA